MFEKESLVYGIVNLPDGYTKVDYQKAEDWRKGAEFGYNKGKAETALLSQHILDLQKDKGNLTDRVRELEQQIEEMKCCSNCQKDCGSIDRRICVENNLKDWQQRRIKND